MPRIAVMDSGQKNWPARLRLRQRRLVLPSRKNCPRKNPFFLGVIESARTHALPLNIMLSE